MAAVAVFDAVINNSDRKGSHLVREAGAVRGFDHGVSLHDESKLRTVLWGWAGRPLPGYGDPGSARLASRLEEASPLWSELEGLLTDAEVRALRGAGATTPGAAGIPAARKGWPAIPWPPL